MTATLDPLTDQTAVVPPPEGAATDGPESAVTLAAEETPPAPPPSGATEEPHTPEFNKAMADYVESIQRQNLRVIELHRISQIKKEEASSAKKTWESAVEELQTLIADAPGSLPLLDGPLGATCAPDCPSPGCSSTDAPEATDTDAWREMRLDNLLGPDGFSGISPRYIKALAEHNPAIETMGDLADWQKEKADFWAKDIHGLGKIGEDEIADATAKYWVDHPQGELVNAEFEVIPDTEKPLVGGLESVG